MSEQLVKARIPRRRHRHRLSREDPRRRVRRAIEVIPVTSRTTRRHSLNDPREDVGVGFLVVECELNGTFSVREKRPPMMTTI